MGYFMVSWLDLVWDEYTKQFFACVAGSFAGMR